MKFATKTKCGKPCLIHSKHYYEIFMNKLVARNCDVIIVGFLSRKTSSHLVVKLAMFSYVLIVANKIYIKFILIGLKNKKMCATKNLLQQNRGQPTKNNTKRSHKKLCGNFVASYLSAIGTMSKLQQSSWNFVAKFVANFVVNCGRKVTSFFPI